VEIKQGILIKREGKGHAAEPRASKKRKKMGGKMVRGSTTGGKTKGKESYDLWTHYLGGGTNLLEPYSSKWGKSQREKKLREKNAPIPL